MSSSRGCQATTIIAAMSFMLVQFPLQLFGPLWKRPHGSPRPTSQPDCTDVRSCLELHLVHATSVTGRAPTAACHCNDSWGPAVHMFTLSPFYQWCASTLMLNSNRFSSIPSGIGGLTSLMYVTTWRPSSGCTQVMTRQDPANYKLPSPDAEKHVGSCSTCSMTA